MKNDTRRMRALPWLFGLMVLGLQGCDSGSFGSNVGNQQTLPPVAGAVIVGHDNLLAGGAMTAVVRSGSEVILAAPTSYGVDGPIVDFSWTPTNADAQAVATIKRSASSISFTAPFVAATTALNYTLTITDADGETATADVVITVEAIPDPNHFLTYLGVPTTFTVVTATGENLASDTAFDVSVQLQLTYPDRQGNTRSYAGDIVTKSGTWRASQASDPNDESAIGNPRILFPIPSVDIDDINLPYVNLPPGDPARSRILDLKNTDRIDTNVVVTLTTTNADPTRAKFFIPGTAPSGASIESTYNGSAQEAVVALNDLVAQPTDPNAQPFETAATAALYYSTIDPANERMTLDDWLAVNCFDPSASDFGADTNAVYTNNFDLGFGRDMYMKSGSQCANGSLLDGDIASVVINYASLQGAAKKIDPVIAVAMEYTAALPPFDASRNPNDRFAKFYVFAPDEGTGDFVRIGSANFDGRGEKMVPGVCTVCHGGQAKPVQTANCDDGAGQCYADSGDVDSIFMPWDIDSFLFSGPDGDPFKDSALPASTQPRLATADLNVLNTYTLANQEDALRELNEAVLATYPDDAPVRELVHNWYHDPASATPPDYPSNALAGSFQRGTIPAGWQNVPNDPDNELYLGVVAQNCRACHTQLATGLQPPRPGFASYQDFEDSFDTIANVVFTRGEMPLARLTMDRFWVDYDSTSEGAAEILANVLGVTPGTGNAAASVAVLGPIPADCELPITVSRNDNVRLDATGSGFAQSFAWDIAYANGPGSTAEMVGADGPQPAFQADTYGEWTTTVTATGSNGSTDSASCIIQVNNEVPTLPSIFVAAAINEGGTVNNVNLRTLIADQALCTTATCFGDEPATVSVNTASPNARGTIQIVDAETGTFNFTSTQAATAGPGIIGYTVQDLDGDVASGFVQINIASIAGPIAANRNQAVAVNTQVAPSQFVFSGGNSLLSTSSGGVPPLNVTGVTQGTNGGSVSLVGNNVTYVPQRFATASETFQYTVTDSNPVNPKSDTATVTITLNRQTTFANAGPNRVQTVLSGNCNGCHGFGGFFAGEPNWSSYAVVTANNLRVNIPDGPNDTGDAPGSQLLTVPCTGTLPAGGAHAGGSGLLSGCPPATLSPATEYGIVRRWIEEGAFNN